ncbi:CobW family GTP-binding protein [Candidatus Poriferisodalis sp.]|uniref:CobW family GTP-binding protein n=1 Tax=Candidatus Poriferisodalis sp. TaxID=3101277 RepID=UPI003B014C71
MSGTELAWRAVVGSISAARRRPGAVRSDAVGVTVLTGFLGSGKTTLLRRLLTEPAGLRIAAVVNDIGPVNIDAAALDGPATVARPLERVELTNGCACCVLVGDLAETLERLAAPPRGDARCDAIVVEASGASDPAAMALAVESAAGCSLDGVVAVADAQQLACQLDDPRIGPAVRRQIDVSHLVVLSKTDQVDCEEVASLTSRIGELAPGRMVVPSVHGRVDPQVLLSAALRGVACRVDAGEHPLEVATAVVKPAGPWDPAAVAQWLDSPPCSLLRAKGWFASLGGWHHLQAVGRSWRIEPVPGPRDAAVVLIGDDQASVDAAAVSLQRLGCALSGQPTP